MNNEYPCILSPREVRRGNGQTIILGRCYLCGRNLPLSRANKTGAKCNYEGAQYDARGNFLYTKP